MNPTDLELQEMGGRLVEDHIIECVSTVIWEWCQADKWDEVDEAGILQQYPAFLRDYELTGKCSACGEEKDLDDDWRQCEECYEPDPDEALEHWTVSAWLAGQLKDRGEMVGEFMGLTIWGRCCSGQAILLDCVIQDIAQASRMYTR